MTNYLEYITRIENICVGNMILWEYAKIRSTMGRTMALIKIGTVQRLTDYLKEQERINLILSVDFMRLPELCIVRLLHDTAKRIHACVFKRGMNASLVITHVNGFRRYQKDILNLILPNFPLCQKYKPEKIELPEYIKYGRGDGTISVATYHKTPFSDNIKNPNKIY